MLKGYYRKMLGLIWSKPKRVNTKLGERILQKADATEQFWEKWKADKQLLKDSGISVSKTDEGDWEVCWWQEIPKEEREQRAQSFTASFAKSTDFCAPVPEGLSLRPYQNAAVEFISKRDGTLLGDEMGLGKTPTTIAVINYDPSIRKVLIVCPATLKENWRRELERWLTKDLTVDIATSRYWPDADIIIINYDILAGKNFQIYDLLVLDEAHYIKDKKSIRSQVVAMIEARKKIFLTGTPIPNRPKELFNLIRLLDSVHWGNSGSFAKRYCGGMINDRGRWDDKGASNLEELQQRLRETVMIRRLKKDVLTELPPKIRQIVPLPINPFTLKLIKEEQALLDEIDRKTKILKALAAKAKGHDEGEYQSSVKNLKDFVSSSIGQIAVLRHNIGRAKVPEAVEYIEECLEEQNKIVVFAYHHDVIADLADKLKRFNPVVLTGETKVTDRMGIVDSFQNDPDIRLIICNIKAGGVGITLTAASMSIFVEEDWTPSAITQAEDRLHRIGQQDSVLIQHLVVDGSLDARLIKVWNEKADMSVNALDSLILGSESEAMITV